MSHFARDERRHLVELFRRRGPDAPTLCEGWTTADLASHLILREYRIDATAGILISRMSGYTERVQNRIRDRMGWTGLLAKLAGGPPPPVRLLGLDEAVNTAEFFLHIEDVRRVEGGWTPRDLASGLESALWKRARLTARLAHRTAPVGVTFIAPGFGHFTIGRPASTVTVTGSPAEILLYIAGRSSVARVGIDGPDDAIVRLGQIPFGL